MALVPSGSGEGLTPRAGPACAPRAGSWPGPGAHGPPNADPPARSLQCPCARQPTDDADEEEDTLKRKLEELTGNVSDAGASSEEDGEDEGAGPGRSTASERPPRTTPEVRPPAVASAGVGPGSAVCG